MRFDVTVTWDRQRRGWHQEIVAGDGSGDMLAERFMPRLAEGARSAGGFPQPDPGELAAIPEDHRALCDPGSYDRLRDAYMDIAARDAGATVIRPFSGYLFSTLLGVSAWQAVRTHANDENVELALRWSASETDLTRLPWEMMRGPQGYLARVRGPEASMTRIVTVDRDERPVEERPSRTIAPRVLFVVGTDLTDANIRWGAEYLGLLRHLQRGGLSLVSKIILRASPEDVVDAINEFRPSVVHFICHGSQEEGGVLKLRSELDRRQSVNVTAEGLSGLVTDHAHMPDVVVLNACHSGGQHPAYLASPMSAELVERGVPVVVGMWGQVADEVCRLFTRRFYEALLDGHSIVVAAGSGRREGFERAGVDPERSPDWAFPAIFLAEDVSPDLTASEEGLREARQVDQIARDIATSDGPRVFCDRFDLIDEADRYLIRGHGRERSVLALEGKEPSAPGQNGKTRLLAEIAAQAAREGLIPCLLTKAEGDGAPTTGPQLAKALLKAVYQARERFELRKPEAYATASLLSASDASQLDAELPTSVQHALLVSEPQGDLALAAALRADVAELAADGSARPIVLIDELQTFGEGALQLAAELLKPAGFGTPQTPVPVVITFSGSSLQEHGPGIKTLLRLIGQTHVLNLPVAGLPSPMEDNLPYQQFLLFGYERASYVVNRDPSSAPDVSEFYSALHRYVQGVPSRLDERDVRAHIDAYAHFNILLDATDEDIVTAATELEGGQ